MSTQMYRTFYDVSRFVLWADSPSEDGKRARFVLSFRDGNPRFIVYTGGTGRDTSITFPMDYITITNIMTMLKEIAVGPNNTHQIVESLTTEYVDDKPTQNKRVSSTLHLGKSKDGIVYLSITAEGRPKIVFPIKSSPFHVYRNSAKEELAQSVVSQQMTIGLVSLVLAAVSRAMMDYTSEEYASGARKPTEIKGRAGDGTPVGGNSTGARARLPQPQFDDLDDMML